jgi:protein-tyrosine phosphatase
LLGEHIDSADLVLTATAEQVEYVVGLRPDAARQTFVFGEFGRLLSAVDTTVLPTPTVDRDATYARGVALVRAADAARMGRSPLPDDELDDPWGRGDSVFGRVADKIDATVRPLAALLLG